MVARRICVERLQRSPVTIMLPELSSSKGYFAGSVGERTQVRFSRASTSALSVTAPEFLFRSISRLSQASSSHCRALSIKAVVASRSFDCEAISAQSLALSRHCRALWLMRPTDYFTELKPDPRFFMLGSISCCLAKAN